MLKQIQVTKEGLKALQKEYDELVNVKRPKVVATLSRAREEGDLSENNAYQTAKEELEMLDGRIEELKSVLENASVVKTNGNGNGAVAVGTKVTVKANGDKHIFEMVGEWEADPINKKISPESPLGIALIGKRVGEKVEVEAPAGNLTYQILSIE